MQAIRVQQTVEKSGELVLTNLPLEAGQDVEVLLLLPNDAAKRRMTAHDLLNSELIGLWKERSDIVDGATYARQLRNQAQTRSHVTGTN